jgi:hypothetical protein
MASHIHANDDEKRNLEIEKLRSEIDKIKKEQLWFDQKQEIEVNKLKAETDKFSKEKSWSRLLVPSFIQMIPGLAIASITLIIALNQDLFNKRELANTKESVDNARQALKTERDLFELRKQEENIKQTVNAFKSDSIRLAKSIDSTTELYNRAFLEKGAMSIEVANLLSTKNKLTTKLMILPFENHFDQIRKGEFDEFGAIRLVKLYNSLDKFEIKDAIFDSLTNLKSDKKNSSVISFLQYGITKKEKYFTEILNEIKELEFINKDRNDQYDKYSPNDSAGKNTIQRQAAIYWVLNCNWSSERKIQFSEFIFRTLYDSYINNDFYNYLLVMPRIYSSYSPLEFPKKDSTLMIGYIHLNLIISQIDGVGKIIGDKDGLKAVAYHTSRTFMTDSANSNRTEYVMNRETRLRSDCLMNLAFYCPQSYVCLVAKGYEFFYQIRGKVDDDNFGKLPFSFFYPSFQQVVLDRGLKNRYPYTGWVCDSLFAELASLENIYNEKRIDSNFTLASQASSIAEIYSSVYKKNRQKCDNWTNIDALFFTNNQKWILNKIDKREL